MKQSTYSKEKHAMLSHKTVRFWFALAVGRVHVKLGSL